MESIEQTAEERYIWNFTIFLNLFFFLITGDTLGLKCVPFLHQQSSSSGGCDYGNCVNIYLYNHNSVTVTPVLKNIWISPTYSWCKNRTLFCLQCRETQIITTVREVPNVIRFSEQFADTYLILKTSFCASMFFFHKVWNKYLKSKQGL